MATKMGKLIELVVLLSAVACSDGMLPRDEETIKIDPSYSLYIHREDLYEGDKLTLPWVGNNMGFIAPVTQRSAADAIPFSLEGLPLALKLLGIPENSSLASDIAVYIKKCEPSTTEGEKIFCMNSFESMADVVKSVLGPRLNVLETKLISEGNGSGHSNGQMQEYTLKAITFKRKPPSRSMSCHVVPYVHAAFLCHESHPELFKILLEGEDGTTLNALVVCHPDTRNWNPEDMGFKVLKLTPAQGGICHLIPEGHFFWYADDHN